MFRVLGSLAVEHEGRSLPLGGHKQRALLALLLLHANEAASRDVLVDELWGAHPPPSAVHSLEVYVSRLRKVVGKRLQTQPAGYMLEVDPADLDSRRFEDLLANGRAALRADEANRAADLLREALALWRGRPFEDVAYEPFVQIEAARLEELRLACIEERIEADLARGEYAGLVAELEALVARHPLRERMSEQLMLALYRSGRQIEALQVYRDARRRLVEVGVEPSQALRRLEQAILQQDAVLEAPKAAATRLRAPEPPATELVGRTAEIAAASELLGRREVRLLTLTGPGGVGKTRLALAVARTREGDFDLGVVFVSLATVGDADLVPTVIAQAVGITELLKQRLGEQLVEQVGRGKLLLVLDNFEHVLAAAPFVSALVAATDRVKVLVTSRAALRASGEHELEVRPLPEEDAVRLFNLRAEAVLADFEATDAVPAICRRLDGLPLAIELAAARVRVLTLPALLGRLDRRLALLSSGGRDTPARHQTLRATIDWSYQLLDDDERRLFARLAVFVGGCTLEDAAAVAGADLDVVASLIEKSLLRHEAGRITMLETLREYALERLEEGGETDQIFHRHAQWILALGLPFEQDLGTPWLQSALPQLRAEIDNARSAVAWALEHTEREFVLRLILASWAFGPSFGEVAHWYDEALPKAVTRASPTLAHALRDAGAVAQARGESRKADALLLQSLSMHEELGDEDGQTRALRRLGENALAAGDVNRGRAFLEKSLTLATRRDDFRGVYLARAGLGRHEHLLGHSQRAVEMLERSLALARAQGDLWAAGHALHDLGDVALDGRALGRARMRYAEAASIASRIGHDHLLAYCLAGLAAAAALGKDAEASGRLWGALGALEKSSGGWISEGERARYEKLVTRKAAQEPGAFERGLAEGYTLTSEQALNLATPDVAPSERIVEDDVVVSPPDASR
jgi:predicted ATPase/DNA-binding SARP family transcriptional activator